VKEVGLELEVKREREVKERGSVQNVLIIIAKIMTHMLQ